MRVAPLGLILALVVSACGGGRVQAAASCRPCASELVQARVDAYASVAKRVYSEEVFGAANDAAFRVISRIPALLDGIATGNYKVAIAAMHHQPIRHAVAVRVTRSGQTLINVSLPFVVGGQLRVLRGLDGASLGQIEISIQDVIGFIKLVRRITGADVVVQGSTGQTKRSLAVAAGVVLPARGQVTISGQIYTVSSFDERGFAGEPFHVWILAGG